MDPLSHIKTENLTRQIEKLNTNIEKQISVKRIIIMALIQGAASVIGATIIAGIIITILARTIGNIPGVHHFFQNIQSQQESQ